MDDIRSMLRRADISQSMGQPMQTQQVAAPSDYDYYSSMFNNFQGDPVAQRSVLMDYYASISPEAQQKRQSSQMFQQLLANMVGGGSPSYPSPSMGEQLPWIGQQPEGQFKLTRDFSDPNAGLMTDQAYQTTAPEEQGTFGFGGGAGQLFGKGGLFHGIVDPLVGAGADIVNGLGGIAQTGARTTQDILGGNTALDDSRSTDAVQAILDEVGRIRATGGDEARAQELLRQVTPQAQQNAQQVSAFANPENAIQKQDAILSGQFGPNQMDLGERWQTYANDPLLQGAKNLATVGSFVVPAKLPMFGAGQIGNNILRGGINAGAQGVAGGSLMGFGQSEKGNELQDTLQGGILGGGIGFGLGASGAALKQLVGKGGTPTPASTATDERGFGGKNLNPSPKAQMYDIDEAIRMQQLASTGPKSTYGTGLGSGLDNARLNYITQNIKDPAKAGELLKYLKQTTTDPKIGIAIDTMAEFNPELQKVLTETSIAAKAAPATTGKGVTGRLREFADNREINSIKRSVGGPAPAKNIGGAELLKIANERSKELGIPIGSADDVLAISDNLYTGNSGQIKPALEAATAQGYKLDTKGIIGKLQDTVDKQDFSPFKKAMQQTVDDISTSLKTTKGDLGRVFEVNRGIGTMGKWKSVFDPTARPSSDLYEKAFMLVRDDLKKAASKVGLSNFDSINKNLQDSINLKVWGETALNRNVPPASVNDLIQDSAIFGMIATGNPAGAIPGYVIGKVTQSPSFEKVLASGARKLANVTEKLPSANVGQLTQSLGQTAQKAGNFIDQSGIANAAGGLIPLGAVNSSMGQGGGMTTQQPVQQSQSYNPFTQVTPIETQALMNGEIAFTQPRTGMTFNQQNPMGTPTGGIGADPQQLKQILAMGVLSGDIDASTAKFLIDTLLGEGSQSTAQKEQQQLDQTIAELERLYGAGTDQSLASGSGLAGIGKTLFGAKQDVRKGVDSDFNTRLTSYKQQTSLAAGILNQLRGAGTLNEGEFQVMIQNMPNEYSTEEEARAWFDNTKRLLNRTKQY